MTTRVRFAPSPTGFLHLGGLRTALFNYLFAARNNGKMILRIEDTDQSRIVPGSVEYLQNVFKWLKIDFDEGPLIGGPHAPYIQSERLSIYQKHASDLIKTGGAYPCFCSKERLQSLWYHPHSSSRGGTYDGFCRSLDFSDVQKRLRMGTPHVVRLKVAQTDSTSITDVVYGNVAVKNEDIGDEVLLKTDGYPTYHLASVVDDHIMEISHVLRGEDWLSSTCKHKILYDAFGWTVPVFVHIPLLLTQSGNKLSKRNKDLHVQTYKKRGYTPEGLINYMALLGWSTKEKEIFSIQELIDLFNLEGIKKAAAIVDDGKLDWLNSIHARRLFQDDNRMKRFVDDLREELFSRESFKTSLSSSELLDSEYLSTIIKSIQERTCLIPNIPDQAPYFWIEPVPDMKKLKSISKADEALETLLQEITVLDFTKELIDASLRHINKGLNIKLILRQCITGGLAGPDIVETMLIIGKKRTITRIKKAIVAIRN